jgi:hypothetical protein
MPAVRGPHFKRSRVTQPTLAGVQGAEGDVAPSQRIQTAGTLVEKQWVADTLTMSEQELDNGGDLSLDSIIRDMSLSHAWKSSLIFCAALEAAVTASTALAIDAGPDVIQSTLAGVLEDFVAAAGVRPDIALMGIARFAQFAGLTDASKRVVPPDLIADALKVTLVVDPALSSDALILAASPFCEFYEDAPAPLSIGVPSVLELSLTFSGNVATYVPSEAVFGFTTS